MKKKVKTPATKLIGNLRIRAENPHKAQKRVDNAVIRNQMVAQQRANQYKLELGRLDSAIHHTPAGLQRAQLLMGREALLKQTQ